MFRRMRSKRASASAFALASAFASLRRARPAPPASEDIVLVSDLLGASLPVILDLRRLSPSALPSAFWNWSLAMSSIFARIARFMIARAVGVSFFWSPLTASSNSSTSGCP